MDNFTIKATRGKTNLIFTVKSAGSFSDLDIMAREALVEEFHYTEAQADRFALAVV